MQRIIGTEVEYGISSPSDPTANPILTSTQAVLAYAAAAGIQRAKRTRWDYEVESPLRDARGFDLSRSAGPLSARSGSRLGIATFGLDELRARRPGAAGRSLPPGKAEVWGHRAGLPEVVPCERPRSAGRDDRFDRQRARAR